MEQCSGPVTFWDGSGSLDHSTEFHIWILLFSSWASKMPSKK
jgi:hypothetical protein